jgi:hypothetical protein
MARARQRADWARTSATMALLANCHRDPRKHRVFQPADFDPFAAEARRKAGLELKDLKAALAGFPRRPKAKRPEQGTQVQGDKPS